MNTRSCPLNSLKKGSWFKLICGASYQYLPAVRNLSLTYSLAGADCIDVAADSAVINAARQGIQAAAKIAKKTNQKSIKLPWLMVSINDGEDPHFRKAQFDATQCPSDCPQPCLSVCPADAINFNPTEKKVSGVIDRLCYGCGRCLPVCPSEIIFTRSHVSTPETVIPWIESMAIEAIEIHTQIGHYDDFKRVWQAIAPVAWRLKVLAISCTNEPGVIDYLHSLYRLIGPLPCPLIWQTDGRSMSGDIGKGTTHAAIAFAQKVLQAKLPGYVQLAGGTNHHTVTKLKAFGMLPLPDGHRPKTPTVAGVAYGSYARSLISPILAKLETIGDRNLDNNQDRIHSMDKLYTKLELSPELLEQAVARAKSLVNSDRIE